MSKEVLHGIAPEAPGCPMGSVLGEKPTKKAEQPWLGVNLTLAVRPSHLKIRDFASSPHGEFTLVRAYENVALFPVPSIFATNVPKGTSQIYVSSQGHTTGLLRASPRNTQAEERMDRNRPRCYPATTGCCRFTAYCSLQQGWFWTQEDSSGNRCSSESLFTTDGDFPNGRAVLRPSILH